jgi:HK97 family phage prohead protease
MKVRKLNKQIPKLTDRFKFISETLNEENRTVEMVFTTSTPVRMLGFTEVGLEMFNEVLSMEKGHAKLDRMNKGAPLLDSHDLYSGLTAQIGVVEKAWVEGEELRGIIRFSKKDKAEEIFKDVKDGIVRNGSIGYRVEKYEDITKDGERTRTLKAVDWEPVEMSLVTVPADSNAQVKSLKEDLNKCEITISERENMPDIKETKTSVTDADKIRKEERQKAAKLIRATRQAGLDDSFAEDLIDKGYSYERCLEMIQEKWAEKDKDPSPEQTKTDVEITVDERDTVREGITEAVLHRAAPAEYEITDKSRQFAHRSALEIAREVVERNGTRTNGMSVNEICKRAFHATSDFPAILENVASKRLQKAYESVPQVFKEFASEATLRDFKQTSIAHLDEAPALELLGEGAEIKYGTVGDSKEVYQLATYAKALSVTRQTIINDDLNAFAKTAAAFGRAAAHLENEVAMKNNLLDNPTMGDGVALYHQASHANLVSSGTALAEGTLSTLKAKLRKQTDSAGRKLNLSPKYLLVGPDQEDTAKKLVAAQSVQGGFNVHGGMFQVLVEALITDQQYHVIADPNQIENLEYAYLEGARGVQVETEQTFDVLGVKIRAYLDFAAKAVNYRAFQKNAGA